MNLILFISDIKERRYLRVFCLDSKKSFKTLPRGRVKRQLKTIFQEKEFAF